MEFVTTEGDELFQSFEIVINDFALLKPSQDLRTNIRAAADRWSITECFCGLFDGGHDLTLTTTLLFAFLSSSASERTRTDQCSRPSAEVLRTKAFTHHFLDVLVDMPSLDVNY